MQSSSGDFTRPLICFRFECVIVNAVALKSLIVLANNQRFAVCVHKYCQLYCQNDSDLNQNGRQSPLFGRRFQLKFSLTLSVHQIYKIKCVVLGNSSQHIWYYGVLSIQLTKWNDALWWHLCRQSHIFQLKVFTLSNSLFEMTRYDT